LANFSEDTYGNEKWWELVELQHIDFSFNAIEAFPAFVGAWTHLVSCNLASNRLTVYEYTNMSVFVVFSACMLPFTPVLTCCPRLRRASFQVLPDEISAWVNCKSLNVSSNLLTALPESIGDMAALVEINASANRLDALPAGLGVLRHLEVLNLRFTFPCIYLCASV
jgi:Leucine-rich repeat (LRR) protein